VIEPRIDMAMLLAREAVNLDRSQRTESTLLATLLRSPAAIASFELPIGVRPLSLTLSPDGRTLLVGADNNVLYAYDPATRRQPRSPIRHFNAEPDPVYSPDGSLLLVADDNRPAMDVLDAHSLRRVTRLTFDKRWQDVLTDDDLGESLFVSPDRRTVYYGYFVISPSGKPGPGYLDRWALPSGRLLSSSRVSSRGLAAIRLVDGGTRVTALGDTTPPRHSTRGRCCRSGASLSTCQRSSEYKARSVPTERARRSARPTKRSRSSICRRAQRKPRSAGTPQTSRACGTHPTRGRW
jgi:hypothetical protein